MSSSESPVGARRLHWEAVYREKNENEVSWFHERAETSLALVAKTGVDSRGSIVDAGGGASRLIDGLINVGYTDIAVVDIAEAALARTKERLSSRASRVRFIASDLLTWEPDATFDIWHDRAVFHFMVRPEDRRSYLATLRRALKPGGHAIIATFAPDGPEKCSGLPVRRYTPETLAAELGPEFRLLESVREEHATPWGTPQAFQYSRFQRAIP